MPQHSCSNVTALSQKYNSTLYVYVPRNGPRPTIPRHPDAAGGISSVSFVDDKYGNAVKICSTCLVGRVWLADIWSPNQPVLRVESYDSPLLKEGLDRPFVTWSHCSLVLANEYCLTVHSEEELLGAPLEDLEVEPELQPGSHPMVNIANYIRDLPENPCTQSPNDGGFGNMTDETVTYEWSGDGTETDTVGQSHEAEDNGDDDDKNDDDDMLYESSCSNSEAEDDDGPNRFNMNPQREEHVNVSELAKLAKRHHLIRMYQKDCAMHPLYRNPDPKRLPEHGVVFPDVLAMHYTHDQRLEDLQSHFVVSDTMDKVVHIPELFLLVIRSGLGRVMLVTPMRLARPIKKPTGVLRYELRLEWVLPRRSDEAVHRTNMRPLHGMAVGPVQEDGVTDR
ncbi:hypothetical protein E4U59_003814 [Claviceps monticola]|nr:hypothetical protein E4U59_003814 [Claviceps monticola]